MSLQIDVVDLLTSLGVRDVSRSGGEISFCCIFHNDSTPSASMNARTGLWCCFGCGEKGTVEQFLERAQGISPEDARQRLDHRYGSGGGSLTGSVQVEVKRILSGPAPEEQRVPPPVSFLRWSSINWCAEMTLETPWGHYMLTERGLDPEWLEFFEVGYDRWSHRISIPVRDRNGWLIGIKGRAIDLRQSPRYTILGDKLGAPQRYTFHTYQKSHHVYALHRAEGEEGILVEGEISTITMHAHGFRNAVGVAGSEFSEIQAQLVAEKFSRAVVYFDDDDAGRKGVERVLDLLHPLMPIRVVVGARGDAAEIGAEEVRGLIDGAVPATKFRAEQILI